MKTIKVSKKEYIFNKTIDIDVMSVKTFRENLGLKQEDFAKIIGTSKVNYSKKENGSVKFSLPEAYEIAKHFNKTIEEIFYNHEVSKIETKR